MSGHGVRFTRARYAPTGGARTSALAIGWAVAVIALLACAGWAAFAWLAPVPETGVLIAPPPVPPTPALVPGPSEPIAQRAADLTTLTETNAFVSPLHPDALATASPDEDTPAVDATPEPDTPAPTEIMAADDPDLPPIPITRHEDAPDDVRTAYLNLKLVGLHRGRDGTPYASISLLASKQGGPPPLPRGADFTDPAHQDHPWTVSRVDMNARRAIVTRSDLNLALPLFPLNARFATAGGASSVPGPGEVVIAYRTIDEAIQEMREAGVSDDDLVAVLSEMKRLEDEAQGIEPPTSAEAATAKLDQILPGASNPDDPDAPGAPSSDDFERIIRLMASGESPLSGDDPQPEPSPEEAPSGDGDAGTGEPAPE